MRPIHATLAAVFVACSPPTDDDALVERQAPVVFGADTMRDPSCGPAWVRTAHRSVARLIVSPGAGKPDLGCTAFLAGTRNRMVTASHCLAEGAAKLSVWFDWSKDVCGGPDDQLRDTYVATVVAQNATWDIAVIQLDGDALSTRSALPFGVLADPESISNMLIPHHPGSTTNPAYFRQFGKSSRTADDAQCVGSWASLSSSWLLHRCDTLTGSSGAPVLRVTPGAGSTPALHVVGIHVGSLGGGTENRATSVGRADVRSWLFPHL